MTSLRLLADLAVGTWALVAAAVALAGFDFGRDDGRADTLASFAPFAFCLALGSALLAWLLIGPSPAGIVVLGMCAAGAGFSLANLAPEFLKLRPARRQGPPVLRVLSGNVYGMNRMGEAAVAAVLARDADVVMLQEAGRRMRGALAGLEARYPHRALCPHAGLAIYAKRPLAAAGCNCAQAETPRGRLLTATIALADGAPVTLATTHFSHPYRGDAQRRERQSLAASVRELDVGRLILAGDFNTAAWSPGMGRQDALLSPLRRWSIAWLTWPARLLAARLTWPLPLLPIDHVYAGPDWSAVRLRRVRIPGSDHFATEAALWLR